MLGKLQCQILVSRVMQGQLQRDLKHILAKQRHPGRSIRLFQITSGGQRCAAVEDPDIVQAQKTAFKDIAAGPVFAVDPPGKIEHQFLKGLFQKSKSPFPALLSRCCKLNRWPRHAPVG